MEAYTKLKCTIKDSDKNKTSYTIKENAWDLSIEDFYEMCRCMALVVGYDSELVKEKFNNEK